MCACVPTLDAKTSVLLLMHYREIEKPTNTGRFVPWMLPNGRAELRGMPNCVVPDVQGLEGRHTLVLHPAASRELTPEDAERDPVLLVPDGTWAQARRLLSKEPALQNATRVRLPEGGPTIYKLRKDPRPGHLSTLESVARAVGILEKKEYEQAMVEVLAILVERTLLSRGYLRLDPVHGVVPAGPYSPADEPA